MLAPGVLTGERRQRGLWTSLTHVNQQQCRQQAACQHPHHSVTVTCTAQYHCTSHTATSPSASATVQEAQLLLGDRATRKHAKDS